MRHSRRRGRNSIFCFILFLTRYRIRPSVSTASSMASPAPFSFPSQRLASERRNSKKSLPRPLLQSQTRIAQNLPEPPQSLTQTLRQVFMVRSPRAATHLSGPPFRAVSYDDLGPTSTEHLLHSQASISSRIYETYDARNNHTFEVSKAGDGLITVRKPTVEETAQLTHTKPVDRIERETIEQLVNAYFTDVAPLLPVITKAEFLATPNPAPILLYSMCLVAAARRQVPQMVFDSVRFLVNTIIKSEDVLSTASIPNVQALLILCMSGDCHSQFVPNALSALWIRLGTAIRMVSHFFFSVKSALIIPF